MDWIEIFDREWSKARGPKRSKVVVVVVVVVVLVLDRSLSMTFLLLR